MTTPPAGKKPARITIELPSDLEATYANISLISHTPSEVILDFARVLPNIPKAKIHARLILTPMNAKLLHRALGENLAKFEGKYGQIQTPDSNVMLDPDRGFTS